MTVLFGRDRPNNNEVNDNVETNEEKDFSTISKSVEELQKSV